MGQKFVNNLSKVTTADINNIQVTVEIDNTTTLPILGVGDWMYLTVSDPRETGGEVRWEIIRVNNWSGNTLFITRGQDNTTAQSWLSGSKLSLRVVSSDMVELVALKSSKGIVNGIAPLDPNAKVPIVNLPDYINPSIQAKLDEKVKTTVSTENASHTIRSSTWLKNYDGVNTGTLAIKITDLYNRTMSGAMEVIVTQNDIADGAYPDYTFWLAGNWRASDHTWHNTEARMETSDTSATNIRFGTDGVDVFMLIGDVNKVWKYPRVIIRDVISNNLVDEYSPEFSISLITTLPTTINSTIVVTGYSSNIHLHDDRYYTKAQVDATSSSSNQSLASSAVAMAIVFGG
jgi:hypothetical protein